MIDSITLTPRFPSFQGPLDVGSTTIEIPIDEIQPSATSHESVSTIKARIFYPTSQTSKSKPIYWLQDPQYDSIAAYVRFMGAGDRMARAFSYVPSPVKRTKIPAFSDSPLLEPQSENGKWPVVMFSHGLGGTLNAYSYLCGSLASCGMVVFAIEHRDGSAPVSHITARDGSISMIDYKVLAHEPTEEVLSSRNEQLLIRFTELDMLYTVVDQLNQGVTHTNLTPSYAKHPTQPPVLTSKLDLAPSRVTWIGHSFGAATMVQFLKSVYWSRSISKSDGDSTTASVLYTPAANGKLNMQITSKSPLVLLDLWTMPLCGEQAQWLYDQPLPCFNDKNPNSSTVLSIMSQEFYNWEDLRERTKYVLTGRPEKTGLGLQEQREQERCGPRLFYVRDSAHLSQSDFGILFPWVTKRFMGVAEPERIMNLNLRAILQLLRENSIPVSPIRVDKADVKLHLEGRTDDSDTDILSSDEEIRNWTAIPLCS